MRMLRGANPFAQHTPIERERHATAWLADTVAGNLPSTWSLYFADGTTDEYHAASAELRSRINVSRALLAARLDLGLTQEDVAKTAGVYQCRVSQIESFDHNATFDTLDRIAAALGLEITLVPRSPASRTSDTETTEATP